MSEKIVPGEDWWNTVPTSITLPAEDYDAFVEHMLRDDHKPTEGAIRGAALLRKLYGGKQL